MEISCYKFLYYFSWWIPNRIQNDKECCPRVGASIFLGRISHSAQNPIQFSPREPNSYVPTLVTPLLLPISFVLSILWFEEGSAKGRKIDFTDNSGYGG